MENPFNREKSEKPQGEQQRRDPSPRTDRRAIDVVTDKKTGSKENPPKRPRRQIPDPLATRDVRRLFKLETNVAHLKGNRRTPQNPQKELRQ